MTYRFVGTRPDELANGRPLVFGDVVALTRREVRANRRLIDEGLLVRLPLRRQAPETHDPQESDQ